MLLNASIVRSHWLQPPAFGFEGTMRVPRAPTDHPRFGTHLQHVLHIRGTVPKDFNEYHLRVDMHVRGALWRTQTHALCQSLHENEEFEVRPCAVGKDAFDARLWAFEPSHRPWPRPPSSLLSEHLSGDPILSKPLPPPSRPTARLRYALSVLGSINVCKLSGGPPLPDRLVGVACNESAAKLLDMSRGSRADLAAAGAAALGRGIIGRVSPDALMQSYAWRNAGKSDMFGGDWRAIGAMFVLACLTLPQPFTIVESGNFCGGTTGYLALLRRELCPSCPFLSLDPGAYRRKRHAHFSCNRDALAFAGLEDQVVFVDEPSPVAVVEQPVGFVYMDGGKVRFCNMPLVRTARFTSLIPASLRAGFDCMRRPDALASTMHSDDCLTY